MTVLNIVVIAVLLVGIMIGTPAIVLMGNMILDPFLKAQARDRARANAATSPAHPQRHLTLVKSTDVRDTHSAA